LATNYVAYVCSAQGDLSNATGNVAPFLWEADARLQEGSQYLAHLQGEYPNLAPKVKMTASKGEANTSPARHQWRHAPMNAGIISSGLSNHGLGGQRGHPCATVDPLHHCPTARVPGKTGL